MGRAPGLGSVIVSTLGVGEGLLAVGGLTGELLVGSLEDVVAVGQNGRSDFRFRVSGWGFDCWVRSLGYGVVRRGFC